MMASFAINIFTALAVEGNCRMAKVLRRLSCSYLRGQVVADKEGPVYIAKVACNIKKSVTKESASIGRASTSFIGEFYAVKWDGDEFYTNTMYFPEYFANAIESKLAESPGGIQFGCKIYIVPTNTKIGFEYRIDVIGELMEVRSDLSKLLEEPPQPAQPADKPKQHVKK